MNVVTATYTVAEKKGHPVMSSQDAYQLLKPLFNPLQEEFYMLPVVGNECVAEKLFIGGLGAANVDFRVIFHKLLTQYPNCSSFLMAHNHPSGVLEPSNEDRFLTKQIKDAAELLGYQFLDHIIFANTGYHSFTDQGELLVRKPGGLK